MSFSQRLTSGLKASLILLQERQTSIKGFEGFAEYFNAIGFSGKNLEENVFVKPDGREAIAFMGIGNSEEDKFEIAENIRRAV